MAKQYLNLLFVDINFRERPKNSRNRFYLRKCTNKNNSHPNPTFDFQCRVDWLKGSAQRICHLKEGSLNQQIAELEQLLGELEDEDVAVVKEEGWLKGVQLTPCDSGSFCVRLYGVFD